MNIYIYIKYIYKKIYIYIKSCSSLGTWVAVFYNTDLVRHCLMPLFCLQCDESAECCTDCVGQRCIKQMIAGNRSHCKLVAAVRIQPQTQWHSRSLLCKQVILLRVEKETILTTDIPNTSWWLTWKAALPGQTCCHLTPVNWLQLHTLMSWVCLWTSSQCEGTSDVPVAAPFW